MNTKFSNQKIKPVFGDSRGNIFDILEIPVTHIGKITFKKGAVRGNHYHKKSTQYSYVIGGKLELTIMGLNNKKIKKIILSEGDLTTIPPKMIHIYRALANSSILDITTYARGKKGYEEDTIRVKNDHV
ncbi:MAG: hypothetical protein A3I89_01300 [Candidatus Harrisonbacteria bacterium RIFCSPLOWO2_02_FULL_41_11]|uniref:Cupin type-1 domain-containing protein n=1 Tax=Candidatus Harrisonbacteria bacterium RIFCSPHIGHO2_02_FULL_42_16 TaxID=1798404 RepID=A0A1G1ZKD7_9BACT|nr:MAG: hypothetical protein A3B92_00790 [Candidatus Harrisonbacteria bacterium RIFCSPHIGHO2_02_FULL_42_16]OGY67606.1 MAG: hypothetical protein A3I89_01300 [Candidatus Harrisonbacteria bacterium RIFCSPLOWO2_02_FULL_41_11]